MACWRHMEYHNSDNYVSSNGNIKSSLEPMLTYLKGSGGIHSPEGNLIENV